MTIKTTDHEKTSSDADKKRKLSKQTSHTKRKHVNNKLRNIVSLGAFEEEDLDELYEDDED